MYASIFVDIIGPLRVLSLGLQTDDNDPVKALRRIKEFDWTMVKLQGSTFGKATFDKFRKDCKPTGDDKNQISYQGVVLTNYPRALNGAAGQRQEWIDAIILCLGNRFSDLQETPVYKHLCPIIDTQSWPGEEVNLVSYGDESVTLLVDHFIQLLKHNVWDVSNDTMLTEEWSGLKLLISETYGRAIPYLDVWAAILSSPVSKEKFLNVLNIVELLLITPISNAVVERMFSTMAKIKPHLRNRMSRGRLDSQRISEEGPSVEEYDSAPAIERWYEQKKRRIGYGGHAYPEKRKKKVDTLEASSCSKHAYFSDQDSSESN